ncbi:MAG: class I SAM-dependent methyltransferase [Bryobacteraceae bacterium]
MPETARRTRLALEQIRTIWHDEAQVEDAWAEHYDKIYEEWQPCYRLYKEKVASIVHACWQERPGRVLEVGCGTGAVLSQLATLIPAGQLAGVDISHRMIEIAARKLPEASFAAKQVEEYKSPEPFEVVYFCGSLHHMPDQRLVADSIHALTAPGARVVVCEPNQDWLYQNVWLNRLRRIVSPSWIWLRLSNAGEIAKIQRTMRPLDEPAFHEHIDAAAVVDTFGRQFDLRSSSSDFHLTRLFEGVLTGGSGWAQRIGALREADARLARQHPLRGGAIEMVFERRSS